MRSNVNGNVAALREALAADRTDERLFASVDSHMFVQVSHLRESLLADFTRERLFAGVTTNVNTQRARLHVILGTVRAVKDLVLGVMLHVL